MNMRHSLLTDYEKQGFVHLPGYFDAEELEPLRAVLSNHHRSWIEANREFYQARAVNSAYLTGTDFLSDDERLNLFRFIASQKLVALAEVLIPTKPAFMGSQLFFNPNTPGQKNYWHRDPQYHLDLEQQQAALTGPEVLHFRIPLEDEPGIEIVPGSHKNWDTKEELDIRLQQNGHKNWEDLSTGQAIPLEKGDLLIFSALAIHRGLYGGNRMALDILYCQQEPELLKFLPDSTLPSSAMWQHLDQPDIFKAKQKLIPERVLGDTK